MEVVLPSLMVLVALVALLSPVWIYFLSKHDRVNDCEVDLDKVAKFVYDLDDPDTLTELAILADVRRLHIYLDALEAHRIT